MCLVTVLCLEGRAFKISSSSQLLVRHLSADVRHSKPVLLKNLGSFKGIEAFDEYKLNSTKHAPWRAFWTKNILNLS